MITAKIGAAAWLGWYFSMPFTVFAIGEDAVVLYVLCVLFVLYCIQVK